LRLLPTGTCDRPDRPEEAEISQPEPQPARPWPTATYRVQLNADFTFDDAAALAPYLAALGISHLYCSPILEAAPGSTHGYDVVDPGAISEVLGGSGGFARLVQAMGEHGLEVVVDIVPNHMALAGSANRWWWDVLEDGPASRYAGFFDIEWANPDPDAGPSVLMPILGDHLGRVLEAGELGLRRRGGSVVVTYHQHELPLSPRTLDDVLARAAADAASTDLADLARALGSLPHAARTDPAAVDRRHRDKVELRRRLAGLVAMEPGVGAAIDRALDALGSDVDAFEALLARQNYRLAHWRVADDELDYRRFFSITTLVGVRVEDEEVFEESHRLVGELVRAGQVTGLRVDHVDGLRDPEGYLQRLRALAPDAYLVVEKILQEGEQLPDAWPVEGTSGYDHLVAVNNLFVDPQGEAAMTDAYAAFTGETRSFAEVADEAKRHVMAGELAAETDRATRLLAEVCGRRRRHGDHTQRELRDTVVEVVAALQVYRTYVTPRTGASPTDRAVVGAALAAAAASRPELDRELLDLLGRVLVRDELGPHAEELAARFQQLSAPVMAKGVEDTAFYRYGRLLALNEVGGEPGTFGTEPDAFHRHCAHLAERWPATMLTLSTHDTKRSADVRARLALLSELPEAWGATLQRWSAANDRHRGGLGPDRETELAVYQTLVGAWPIDAERVVATMAKATKEAKTVTSWTNPDAAYDADVEAFVRAVMADDRFGADLEAFLADHRLVELGRRTSLAQMALLLTSPGVPDLYQGTELWDLSLVDPDNRRPVDHALRGRLLAELAGAEAATALDHLDDGGAKLWLIARILRHRRRHPEPFRSRTYEPLPVTGPKARHAVAFARDGLVVVVPRLLVGLGDDWADTAVTIPDRGHGWSDLLSDRPIPPGRQPVADLLDAFPAAVLVAEGDR
jgi:(1->4)-alpha-D-glucan 1-alpha-D-glucosylmutase